MEKIKIQNSLFSFINGKCFICENGVLFKNERQFRERDKYGKNCEFCNWLINQTFGCKVCSDDFSLDELVNEFVVDARICRDSVIMGMSCKDGC